MIRRPDYPCLRTRQAYRRIRLRPCPACPRPSSSCEPGLHLFLQIRRMGRLHRPSKMRRKCWNGQWERSGTAEHILEDIVRVCGREAEASPTAAREATEPASSTWTSSTLQTFFAKLVIYFPLLLLSPCELKLCTPAANVQDLTELRTLLRAERSTVITIIVRGAQLTFLNFSSAATRFSGATSGLSARHHSGECLAIER